MKELQEVVRMLQGKTITSVEPIRAEYGRTYTHYLCLTFSDGTKYMLHGGIPYEPRPTIEEMQKASSYFTAEDIAAQVFRNEQKRREQEQRERAHKLRTFRELQQELGQDPKD